MPEQTQSNSQVLGSGSVTVKKPDTSFSGDVEFIKALQESIPKYQGYDPYSLKRKALQDEAFFNEISTDFFEHTTTDEERSIYNDDPNAYATTFNRVQKNIRQELNKSAYSGQLPKQTLVKRGVAMENGIDQIPIEKYKSLIQNNPKEFAEFGILEDGQLLFNDDASGNTSLAQKIYENPKLHEALSAKSYNEFEQELSKSHNSSRVLKDITQQSQAYAVYNAFGSEGLTQYINLLQYPKGGDESIADSFQQRDEALEFFQNAKVGDDTAEEVIKQFVVGKKVKGVNYVDFINRAGLNSGVAPSLLAGMFKQESGFRPDSVSSAGAGGVAQFMPLSAKEMGLNVPQELVELDTARVRATEEGRWDDVKEYKKKLARLSKQYKKLPEQDERFNPEKSIDASARYLRKLLDRFDSDPQKAVAAYNAGPSRVERAVNRAKEQGGEWLDYIDIAETVAHVPKVMKNVAEFGPIEMTHEPLTARDDIQKQVPQDTNNYTVPYYKGNPDGSVDNKDESDVLIQFANKYVPENYKKHYDVKRLAQDGLDSSEGRKLSWAIYEEAYNEGDFTIDDLMNTLKANGTYAKDEDGRDQWILDTNKLDTKTLLAFNALQHDQQVSYMFEKTKNVGTFKFVPERREKYSGMVQDIKNFVFDTKTVTRRDEQGNVVTEEIADDGLIAGAWNTLATVGLGAADFLNRFAFEPTVRAASKGYSALLGEEAGAPAEAFASELAGFTDIDLAEGLNRETDGIVPAAIGEAMPFIQYMGAIYGAGSGVVKGGAKALSTITGVKSSADLLRLGNTLNGSKRLAGISAKLNGALGRGSAWAKGAVSKNSPWITGGGIFYTGGAVVEATQPDERSFVQALPQMVGFEPTNKLRETYQTASASGKVGMDIAASLTVDLFADTILRGAVYGKDLYQYGKGKKVFNSTKWSEQKGEWITTDRPQFGHDIKIFWQNLTQDLDKLPISQLGKHKAEGLAFESLDDVTRTFIDRTDEITGYAKKDLEDHIRTLNREIGDGELPESAIKQLATEQYDYMLNNVADQMEGILKQGGNDLPLKFAQTLEDAVPSVKEFKPEGQTISKRDVEYWRNEGYNVFEKDGKVYEASPQFWTIDLANKIRTKNLSPDIDRVTNRLFESEGIPTNGSKMSPEQADRATEIERDVNSILGTHVEVDGKAGFVVDITDDSFVVRTSSGDVRVNNFEDIPERVRKNTTDDFEVQDFHDDVFNDINLNIKRTLDDIDNTQKEIERLKLKASDEGVKGNRKEFDRIYDEEIEPLRKKQKKLSEKEQNLRDERQALWENVNNPKPTKTQQAINNVSGRFSRLSEVEEEIKSARLIGDISETPQAQAMIDVTQQPRTVREAIGRNVTYQGQRGVLQFDDAGFPVVRTGQDEFFEIPSLRNLDQSLDELEIRPYASYDRGVAAVGDKVYEFQKGLDSFEFQGGRPVKAELIDAMGKRSQFTNQDIVDELFMARMAGGDLTSQVNGAWKQTKFDELIPKYDKKLREYADMYYNVSRRREKLPWCD